MKIDVLLPENDVLRQFVDSIYIFRKGTEGLEFTAYPSANTPVALLRNVAINMRDGCVQISNSSATNYFAIACNQFSDSIDLKYVQMVDEIAINFKALGFVSFANTQLSNEQQSYFCTWSDYLPGLFDRVFATDDSGQQLRYIESFLMERYQPVDGEAYLIKALALLHDTAADYKIDEIASLAGIHYKKLYRLFKQNIGCSMAHYAKLVKFRTSIASKINKGSNRRWIDVCYNNGYTDHPYFIKQMKELTGENPADFLKGVTPFGKGKVIFKIK